VARLAQGAPPPDSEAGWAAVRALVEDLPLERPLAVVNPRPPVRQALASTPYCEFLALHADLAEALAAFLGLGEAIGTTDLGWSALNGLMGAINGAIGGAISASVLVRLLRRPVPPPAADLLTTA
jgi:hypothetical protein